MNSPRQNGQAAMTLTRLNLDTDEDADGARYYHTPITLPPGMMALGNSLSDGGFALVRRGTSR